MRLEISLQRVDEGFAKLVARSLRPARRVAARALFEDCHLSVFALLLQASSDPPPDWRGPRLLRLRFSHEHKVADVGRQCFEALIENRTRLFRGGLFQDRRLLRTFWIDAQHPFIKDHGRAAPMLIGGIIEVRPVHSNTSNGSRMASSTAKNPAQARFSIGLASEATSGAPAALCRAHAETAQ